jgi:hypothetical protein
MLSNPTCLAMLEETWSLTELEGGELIEGITSVFGNRPRRKLKFSQRFNKLCTCNLKDESVKGGRVESSHADSIVICD